MTRRIVGLMFSVLALVALAAPAAAADGLPIPTETASGVSSADGSYYVTRNSGGGGTTVRAEDASGTLLRSTHIPGKFTVPAVALDGSPSGLSADGKTLVLIKPRARFPQSKTELLILNAPQLSVLERLTLDGDFSFDAISPNGARLYFIEYLSRTDPTRYAVRAYDVGGTRMLREPIVDPDEHAGEMRGYPMNRVTSADGRWAYTLYDGGGKRPFVHALDTAEGKAVCVDLPTSIPIRTLRSSHLGMSGDSSQLTVLDSRDHPVAIIDTGTFEVSEPGTPAPSGRDGAIPWSFLAPALVLLAAGTLVLRRRHRLAEGGV